MVVLHLVGDGGLGIGDNGLVTIELVRGCGTNLGSVHGDRLVFILDIAMGSNLLVLVGQGLESDHRRVVFQERPIEGEGHIDGAVGVLGNELGLGGDGVAVGIEELLLGDLAVLVGDLLVEGAGNLVGLAGSDVLVLHGIDH